MKKILLQFAALLLVICGIFLLAGRFTHDEPVRCAVASFKNDVLALLAEAAGVALLGFSAQRVPVKLRDACSACLGIRRQQCSGSR